MDDPAREEPAPATVADQGPEQPGRRGWAIHLIVLGAYPLLIGLVGARMRGQSEDQGAMLPSDLGALAQNLLLQSGIFLVFFAGAWVASRASGRQLLLPWRGGAGPVWRGLVYSVALRFVIFVAILAVAVVMLAVVGLNKDTLEGMRPRVEHVVDPQALLKNPAYLIINMTVVSFLFAGLREELWRAGMLAGIMALLPAHWQNRKGQFLAVTAAAIVFGLGHLPQGWGGVALTTILGLGLGAIMVWHRCLWDAVIAHGFFDATTFGLLYVVARVQPDLLPG